MMTLAPNIGSQSNNHQAVFLDFITCSSASLTTRMATCNAVTPFNNDILIFHTPMTSNCHVFLQLTIVIMDMTMHKASPMLASTRSNLV